MKHPTRVEEKRVFDLLEQLEYLFMVNGYSRSVSFKKTDVGVTAADVSIDRSYQRIHISIYPIFWEEDLQDQRKALLHEFCHTVTVPVQEVGEDLLKGKLRTSDELQKAVEETTSRVENLLDAQLRGRNRYARIAYKKYITTKKPKKKRPKNGG